MIETSGEVCINQAEGTVIVSFAVGFKVSGIAVLSEILDEVIAQGHGTIVVDLSNITLTTASALYPFLERWPTLQREGGDVRICGLRPTVREALSLMQVERLPDVFDTVEEAIHAQPVG